MWGYGQDMTQTKLSSHTEVKRLVIGRRKASKYENIRLHVAEYQGKLYATNSYWLVPVARVMTLLGQYNLPTDKPANYVVNGTVRELPGDPPNLNHIMYPDAKDVPTIERATVNGEGSAHAYQRYLPGGFLALFRNESDALIGVDADFLEWITAGEESQPVYRQRSAGAPILITRHRDDEFLGLLMPVRI